MEYIHLEFGLLAELADTTPFMETVQETKDGKRCTIELSVTWFVKSAKRKFICVQARLYHGMGGQKKKSVTRCFMREEFEDFYSWSPMALMPCSQIMDQFPFARQSSWKKTDRKKKRSSRTKKKPWD